MQTSDGRLPAPGHFIEAAEETGLDELGALLHRSAVPLPPERRVGAVTG